MASPERFRLALSSLGSDMDLLRLARMLVIACEEVVSENGCPDADPAVAVLSGRIGFASPADTMSQETWSSVVSACEQANAAAIVRIRPDCIQ